MGPSLPPILTNARLVSGAPGVLQEWDHVPPAQNEAHLGRVTVATLKAEHARGNLEMSKIGRSYFTTLAKLQAMDAKCRVAAPARPSGSIRKEEHGPSSTAEGAAARDSLLMKLDKLRSSSASISRQSTSLRDSATPFIDIL